MKKNIKYLFVLSLMIFAISGLSFGAQSPEVCITALVDVGKYSRAIHIMAMLLVGFGFLMVFVKKYGRSALTATYLLVSIAIPMYFLKDNFFTVGSPDVLIDKLILAEFAAASLLIAAGAVLGRLKMNQYILLGLLFVPFYAFNEWLLLSGKFALVPSFVDTGGSIIIHAFGALFGLGVAIAMTTKAESEVAIESDETSDRYSLLGSMVLWIFWPSFCSALVSPELVPLTAINVVFALCGSTLATYFATVKLRGKISAADIANAALAGGVAIGAICANTVPGIAFIVGIIAGLISTFGFAVIQSKLQKLTNKVDSCGVLNLHGLPGLFGGLVALLVVTGINVKAQLVGIGITVVLALVSGVISGLIISLLGRRKTPYIDSEEFIL